MADNSVWIGELKDSDFPDRSIKTVYRVIVVEDVAVLNSLIGAKVCEKSSSHLQN